MDKNEELQKWLNDDRYVRVEDIMALHGLSRDCAWSRLSRGKIKPEKKIFFGPKGTYFFYNKKQCDILMTAAAIKRADAQKMKANSKYVRAQQLETLWGVSRHSVVRYLKCYNIQPKKEMNLGAQLGTYVFYDRAECERARPFINQPKKEVEQVEQVNLPEPKEQTPDIIPADTIDLFTMSELETELKQRGVELTNEVKAKINASDMPEMQEIATMIRGNAKTIAIRLSVLNEIVERLKDMRAHVENGMTPNAASILKNDSQNDEIISATDKSDSEFTYIRIRKEERQKLRMMAAENRSGITEQLHLIINSLWGLTYRK